MSKPTFTPGPWEYVGFSGTAGMHLIAALDEQKTVAWISAPPESESAKADCNLIAAAPHLYEVAETLLPYFEEGSDEYKLIRAAIARAGGGK